MHKQETFWVTDDPRTHFGFMFSSIFWCDSEGMFCLQQSASFLITWKLAERNWISFHFHVSNCEPFTSHVFSVGIIKYLIVFWRKYLFFILFPTRFLSSEEVRRSVLLPACIEGERLTLPKSRWKKMKIQPAVDSLWLWLSRF